MATTLLSRYAPVRLLLSIGIAILAFAGNVQACAICFSGLVVTPGQKLDAADQAVLAIPSDLQGQFSVREIIKGNGTVGEIVVQPGLSTPIANPVMSVDGLTGDGEAIKLDEKPLLLLHDTVSEKWTSLGTMSVGYADWLRQVALSKHSTETPKKIWPQLTLTSAYLTDTEWRERIVVIAAQLESPEPLVAEIAFGELSRAPYGVTRLLKPQLDTAQLASWTHDPKLLPRRAAYTLLLGIAGGPDTADLIEQDIDAALKTSDATNLSALLAADLELRGPNRVDWLETTFFADRQRTLQQIQAALLALSVHGGADGTVSRKRVIEAYRYFIKARNPMAGFVAMELADWEAWDATADFLEVIRSKAVKDPAEQFAILSYLQRSPLTTAQAALRAFAD